MKKIVLALLTVMLLLPSCAEKETILVINTSMGDMKIKLYNETPKHRDNFVKLVKEGFYEDLLFHRVIPQFMIQGGDPDSKGAAAGARLGTGGPGYKVDAEILPGLFHKRGALSAARQGGPGNPEKKSSGSQFYVVTGKKYADAELTQMASRMKRPLTEEQKAVYMSEGGTPFLDGDYTVFGEVIEGIEIAEKIALVAKDRSDRPNEDVKFSVAYPK